MANNYFWWRELLQRTTNLIKVRLDDKIDNVDISKVDGLSDFMIIQFLLLM